MYLLVTNKSALNKAQNEVDNLLQNMCWKHQSTPYKNCQKEKSVLSFTTKSHPMPQPYLKTLSQLLSNQWLTLLLSTKFQYPSPSLQSQSISTKHGHYPHPNFLLDLTFFLFYHFIHLQPRNVKFKPKNHLSSQQLQMIPPTTN